MAVIKVDDELYKRIKKLIKEGDNRFDYPTVKSFVDKAVFSTLKELEEKDKTNNNSQDKSQGNDQEKKKSTSTASQSDSSKKSHQRGEN